MNTFLLYFEDGDKTSLDLKGFVDSLDEGAKMLSFDGRVCFLKTGLSLRNISDRFEKVSGSRLYFLSDISKSEFSGRMPGRFWQEFDISKVRTAAE